MVILSVSLAEVIVEYGENETLVVITGTVEWTSLRPEPPIMLKQYELHIDDSSIIIVKPVSYLECSTLAEVSSLILNPSRNHLRSLDGTA